MKIEPNESEFFSAQKGNFLISTDKSRLDLAVVYDYLCNHSYWAAGRSMEAVKKTVNHSLCFGVYFREQEQVGFARIVTDWTTITWICDLFILEPWQGQGLGKWLIQTIMDHPELKFIRRHLLATRDAHGLYRDYGGFQPLSDPARWMTREIDPAQKKQSTVPGDDPEC